MPASEFHKPPARQVENCDRQNPRGVDEGQTMTISGRSLREVCDDGSVKDRLMESQGNDPGHAVEQVEVQEVIEERHPTIYQQDSTEAPRGRRTVEQSEQNE